MKTKIVFQTDSLSFFVGTVVADESPLEPGVFLIPAGCVEVPPPSCKPEEIARWVSDGWVKEKLQVDQPTAPVEEVPTQATVEAARLLAYADPITGSDRLFVEALRMQMMKEDGFEAVRSKAATRYLEIQAMYPWPAEEKE